MRPAPKAIIFDFDGVIADSEIASARAFSAALSEAGIHMTVEEATELYVGLIRAEVLHLMASHWGDRLPQDMAERVQRHVDRIFADPIEPVRGVKGFLDTIGHLPIAIGSSSYTDYIRRHLANFGLEDRFGTHVYSGREHVTRGKPDPDIYLHAAAQLGIHPSEVVIIEDSPVGARAAVASGARVIGFVGGSHARPALADALLAEGVEVVLGSYEDIAVHLGVSARRAQG
jgi:beta-phosphoglucomutase-like phosphatase (HAD superfamily)